MKYIVLIAIILALIFGIEVALGFVGSIWHIAVVILFVGSILMAISSLKGAIKEESKYLRADKLWAMIGWIAGSCLWGWVLSFCF